MGRGISETAHYAMRAFLSPKVKNGCGGSQGQSSQALTDLRGDAANDDDDDDAPQAAPYFTASDLIALCAIDYHLEVVGCTHHHHHGHCAY